MTIPLERPSATKADIDLRLEMVQRATELVPLLADNARRTEDERRVAEANITAISQAGLFSLMQPKRLGGLEVDFRTNLEVTAALGRGCGSTAWVTSLVNVCHWFVGMFNEQAQNDVWGTDPATRVAGVLAPTGTAEVVDGGYRVSGTWGWCTGCLHAQWAILGLPTPAADGRPADQGLILVPMSELTIQDTWFVSGMKGTGSNTVVAEDVFVPAHRFVSVFKLLAGQTDNPREDEPIYRAPFMPGGTIILAGAHLGLARAALDLVIGKTSTRGIAYTFYDVQADAPTVQLAVAKAASLIDVAELLVLRATADIDEAAAIGRSLPELTERARVRMDTVQAVTYAREAIRELVSAHGASSFAESSPLQRIWRDSEVASRHAIVNPAIGAESYGRALLGKTDLITPLL